MAALKTWELGLILYGLGVPIGTLVVARVLRPAHAMIVLIFTRAPRRWPRAQAAGVWGSTALGLGLAWPLWGPLAITLCILDVFEAP